MIIQYDTARHDKLQAQATHERNTKRRSITPRRPFGWTIRGSVFSRHVFAHVVKRLTTRLHSQRANATSTPAFVPHPPCPAKRPAAEPESNLQYHRLVHDPHPEQCKQPDDDECGKWKGGGGTGAVADDGNDRVVVVVGGGMRVPQCGGAVLRVAVTVKSIQVVSLWRMESGGGGRKEEIGFIALLPAVWLSRIAVAASTDRTRMHVVLSVDDMMMTMTMEVAARQRGNSAHIA